jgi:hypothetical protein
MASWMCRVLGVVALALSAGAPPASAQTLTIQGDRFAIDGKPKFLTFMSYFAAMSAPNIAQDFRLLRTLGFDGVRIWPLLDTGPQLLNGDGTLRSAELARLRFVLDQARIERLVVDVTFTHEHIAGLTPANTKIGIMNAAEALRSYDNILFDIQNERNIGDRRFLSEADVASILAGIKSIDPKRIVTASNSIGEDSGGRSAADFTARVGLDVTALHESRGANWYTSSFYDRVISDMRSNGRPAYLQEPNRTRDNRWAANDRADYFLQAIANAKHSGAAAWCFHTMVAVDWRDGGPAFLEDRLREFQEPEWTFVTSLKPRIMLRAANGTNFVVAEGGGGAGIRADRTAAGPGLWAVWDITTVTGGPILSGDSVALSSATNKYLQATAGGGSTIRAVGDSIGAWETFVIENSGGGGIRDGNGVSLRSSTSTWYVTAEGGGGGAVSATAAARGSFETFTIVFVPR